MLIVVQCMQVPLVWRGFEESATGGARYATQLEWDCTGLQLCRP